MVPARIVRFVRLADSRAPEARGKIELFHLRRGRVDYFVVLRSGTSLSYGIEAKGSSAEVARVFDLELDNLLKGTRLFSGTPRIVADKPDADARKTVKAFDHPMFGLDWGEEPEVKGDLEAEDFYKLLERQLHEWKGGRHSLPLVRHRYWPTFRKMVAEAVAKKWGARFDLFRGVYGDQALKILDEGAPLDVYRFSSWTIDRGVAKDFALDPHGQAGRHFWIVVKAPFKATDVIFAPVILPDFTPNPKVLKRHFTWETEFVVDTKSKRLRPGQFKVVSKTRAKRAAKPSEVFTEEYLQKRKQPPRWLFHFTRSLDHAIKILRSGALKGFPVLSLTENPAMGGPAGPVFVVDVACVKRRGAVLEPKYRRQYRAEAEWKIGELGKAGNIPLSCITEVGWFRSHERQPDKVQEIANLAERRGIKATPQWDWTKHWKRGAKNPYLNTPPTVLKRKIDKETNPMKRRLMNDALNAWRVTQGNPLARSAARVATRWLACGGT